MNCIWKVFVYPWCVSFLDPLFIFDFNFIQMPHIRSKWTWKDICSGACALVPFGLFYVLGLVVWEIGAEFRSFHWSLHFRRICGWCRHFLRFVQITVLRVASPSGILTFWKAKRAGNPWWSFDLRKRVIAWSWCISALSQVLFPWIVVFAKEHHWSLRLMEWRWQLFETGQIRVAAISWCYWIL